MANRKLTVAVCGGGLAGVTAAIALSRLSSEKKDIHIDIYESTQDFTEIGAGIGMLLRPWKIMKHLGIDGPLRKIVKVPETEDQPILTCAFRKSDQTKGVTFYNLAIPFGNLVYHRAALLQCLVEQIDPQSTSIHFSKRLVSFELPSDYHKATPIKLSFKDGTNAKCDVLIGADGIHSSVRHIMFDLAAQNAEKCGSEDSESIAAGLRDRKRPIWSGSVAYRGLISIEELKKINPNHRVIDMSQNYVGKSKHIIAIPIKKRGVINIVAFCSWPEKEGTPLEGKISSEASQEEVLEQFAGWEDEAQQILQCLHNPTKWSICTVKELTTSVYNRVALVGDAAHAMTPHQGSGAGQAFEDVYILAALLAHPLTTIETVHVALKVYETVRLPHANFVMRQSRRNGLLYEFNSPEFSSIDTEIESPEQLSELGPTIIKGWEWAWKTDVEDDKLLAINLFEEHLKRGI